MKINLPERGIIEEQIFEVSKDVSIIYGYNNSGKTSILRLINEVLCENVRKKFVLGERIEPSVYIPTNRVVVSEVNTEMKSLNDVEDFINYQIDSMKEYSLYLKNLRDSLLSNEIIHSFVLKVISEIFDIEIKDGYERLSDGIENIINIYISIIWTMLWDIEQENLTREQFLDILYSKKLVVLIDEIEMFLHVQIQSKLINRLKDDFKSCNFIFTTHSPLFLTRYKDVSIYRIEKGKLEIIQSDVYYKDLDMVYEIFFAVEEFPLQIREYINYLGDVIMGIEGVDVNKINMITEEMQKNYPNLYQKYNKLICKAEYIGEMYGKN